MERVLVITESAGHNIWETSAEIRDWVSAANGILTIEEDDRRILLELEANEQITRISSIIYTRNDFRFSICPEGVIGEIEKFFGSQDLILGYPDFDKKFIIKANQADRTEMLFTDPRVREVLESVPGLTMGIVEYLTEEEDGKVPFLELEVKGLLLEPSLIGDLYDTFRSVLIKVDA